jgi:hypothetical protein
MTTETPAGIIENLKATGRLQIVVRDENGNIKQEVDVPNLVVTTGLNFIASRMKDATATAMTHMAVGTGGTAANVADTTLGAETARVALTSTTVTTNSVAYVATFNAGTGTGALVEAGILNAASVGTLLCRTVYSVVNKGANDSMTITWTVTVS